MSCMHMDMPVVTCAVVQLRAFRPLLISGRGRQSTPGHHNPTPNPTLARMAFGLAPGLAVWRCHAYAYEASSASTAACAGPGRTHTWPWARWHCQQHKRPKPALHSEERLARARPGAMPRSPKRPKRSHREVQLTQADPGGQHCTHRKQNHTSFYLSNFVLIDTVRKWEWNEVIAEQNEHACSTCT